MDKLDQISKEIQAAIELRGLYVEAGSDAFLESISKKMHKNRFDNLRKKHDEYINKVEEMDEYLKKLGKMYEIWRSGEKTQKDK